MEQTAQGGAGSVDLATGYLGLRLRTPLVASPSPLTGTLAGIRELVDAGVGAIVLPSILEEQVWTDARAHIERLGDSVGQLERVSAHAPAEGMRYSDPADTVSLLRAARAAVDVPLIASLNGGAGGGWPAYAHALQQAGADAIELNVFGVPADADASARAIEDVHLELLATVKSAVTIPVAVKLAPWLTAPGELAERLVAAGADGLVLFNRFMQPDIDVEQVAVVPRPELSAAFESRLPMAWIALLRGRVPASLAATTGVTGPDEVVKYVLAGADVVMTASAVLRHGPQFARTLIDGLAAWLHAHGYGSVAEARGLLRGALGSDAVAKRAGYVRFRAAGERAFT